MPQRLCLCPARVLLKYQRNATRQPIVDLVLELPRVATIGVGHSNLARESLGRPSPLFVPNAASQLDLPCT